MGTATEADGVRIFRSEGSYKQFGFCTICPTANPLTVPDRSFGLVEQALKSPWAPLTMVHDRLRPRRRGVSGADALFQQVHVSAQGEARVGMPEPGLELFDVLAVCEEERRSGMPEGVEAHPRHANEHAGRVEHAIGDLAADQPRPNIGGENGLRWAGVVRLPVPDETAVIRGASGMSRRPAPLFSRRRWQR